MVPRGDVVNSKSSDLVMRRASFQRSPMESERRVSRRLLGMRPFLALLILDS